jgi:hypothetical protein
MQMESPDYPEFKSVVEGLWTDLQNSAFLDERDVKRGYLAVVRCMAALVEEKARCMQLIRKNSDKETSDSYDRTVRSMVLRGMAQGEREMMYTLMQPVDVKVAMLKMKELDMYLDSTRRVESVLRGILDCIRVELKLSYEGHE